jgi:hypothetical protein
MNETELREIEERIQFSENIEVGGISKHVSLDATCLIAEVRRLQSINDNVNLKYLNAMDECASIPGLQYELAALREANAWISVDDPPKDETMKLVYNANEEWQGGIAEWSFAWYCQDLKKWVFTNPWKNATHWHELSYPLPQPPEG